MAAYGDDSSLSALTFIPPVTRTMVSRPERSVTWTKVSLKEAKMCATPKTLEGNVRNRSYVGFCQCKTQRTVRVQFTLSNLRTESDRLFWCSWGFRLGRHICFLNAVAGLKRILGEEEGESSSGKRQNQSSQKLRLGCK